MEEIEKNREEVLAYVRSWVEEVRESVFAWISEGKSRSESAGSDIEIKLGVLGSCLEVVMEELQEEGSDKYEQQTSEIASHMSKVERWTSFVREYLKEIKEELLKLPEKTVSQEDRGDLDSNKQESLDGRSSAKTNRDDSDHVTVLEPNFEAAGNDELEFNKSSTGDLQEKRFTIVHRIPQKAKTDFDSDERKTDLLVAVVLPGVGRDGAERKKREFGGNFGVEIEHLGPPPWSSQSRDETEADQSEIELGAIDVLQIEDCAREWTVVKKAGTRLKKDGSDAINGQLMSTKELERDFEKMVLRAAREVQSKKAVWVVGLNGKEPIFFLLMGMEKLGFESYLKRKLVGPPPWSNNSFDNFKKWEMQQQEFGPSLVHVSPSIWPSHSFMLYGGFSLDRRYPILPIKHGPRNKVRETTQWKSAMERGYRLQPSESDSSTRLMGQNYEQMGALPPPPAKPPPHPLKYSLNSSRLEHIFSADVLYDTLWLSGKVGAAGDDSGDIHFHQFLESRAFNLDFTHNLEGKADLKGVARATYVECKNFILPPRSPTALDFTSMPLSKRRDVARDDRGDILFAYSFGATMLVYMESKLEGENSKHEEFIIQEESFYHCPRPPDFANKEKVPLNDRKMSDWLIEETCLQVHAERMFWMLTKLLHFIFEWAGALTHS